MASVVQETFRYRYKKFCKKHYIVILGIWKKNAADLYKHTKCGYAAAIQLKWPFKIVSLIGFVGITMKLSNEIKQ